MRAQFLLLPISICVLIAAGLVAFVSASDAAPSTAVPAAAGSREGHLTLGPAGPIIQEAGCTNITGSFLSIVGNDSCHVYIEPLNLPDGATITNMTVHYRDLSAANDPIAQILQLETNGTHPSGFIGGSLPDAQTVASFEGPAVIDNLGHYYVLYIDFGNSQEFYSATLTYTYPSSVNGDVNCSGAVDPRDLLDLLRSQAALPIDQADPCYPIGG